uniref:Variant surface glycoprotein 1297 n=1 Tax=Trypanosoma brucei TaxID=5691 RepID=M4SY74_9TRYP|nr:variant surface glycoprotein 1297 [Trypanosoma brucei]
MNCKLTYVLLTAVVLLHTPRQLQADDTNAKNMAILSDLCEIIAIATGNTDHIPKPDLAGSDLSRLEVINMSLADDDWRNSIPTEDATQPTEEDQCYKADNTTACKEMRAGWIKAKKSMKTTTNLPKSKQLTAANLKTQLRKSAAETVAVLIEEAKHVAAEYAANEKPKLQYVTDKLARDANEALYSKAEPAAGGGNLCDIRPEADRHTTCKIDKQAKYLCVAAVCLCGEDSTQRQKICEGALTVAVTDWTSTSLKTPFGAIKNKCDTMPKRRLTAAALTSAIDRLLAKASTNAVNGTHSGVVLGQAATSTAPCATEANKGCVDLTPLTVAKRTGAKADESFIGKLRTVALNVQQAEQATNSKIAAEAALKKIQATADAVYLRVSLALPEATQPTPTTENRVDKRKQECDTIKTAAECREKKPNVNGKTKMPMKAPTAN